MWTAQWMCRRCVQALATPHSYSAQFLRYASTEAIRLPPALLQRARSLAAEHDEIQKALAVDFDTQKAKRLGEISSVATALKEWEAAKSSIAELSNMLKSDDKELQILARDELASTHDQLERLGRNLTAALTPKHPFANLPCLIEIRPGPGGLEGRYFTYALFRMYKQYCQRKGFHIRVVQYEISDAGGTAAESGETPLTEAIIEVLDPGAYDEFRAEAGIQRVQRVPGTEKAGRTHTSAVAVWVLPSFPENESATEEADFEDPESIFYINPAEVKSEKKKANGAGGQHVNKTESAVRLTHIPTGIVVSMQDSRSQHKNREAAWKLLRSRLAQKRREEREEEAASLRNAILSKDRITRADKIRTYNYGQDRCTDHRAGLDVHNLPDLLNGGETLDKIIEAAKGWLIQCEIRALIAEEEAKEKAAGKDAGAGAKKDKK